MKPHRMIPVAALAAFTLSGCEFFFDTTIPASDSVDPWAAISLWVDGDHVDIQAGNESPGGAYADLEIDHVTTNPFKTYVAISATKDPGGAREARMTYRLSYSCQYGAPNRVVLQNWTNQSWTQSGSVGDVVKDGVYTTRAFRPINHIDAVGDCPGDAYFLDFEWLTFSRDFHGNSAWYGRGRVRYWEQG